ncbi:polymorphic toxin-type HINT domain-containing protein [Microbulbifer sp. SSSA005]|uniref:polymorphic toxin-type HINT domain-containing protein n=1 Tax=Microbulbifer sp. SSSA005 TaxID=3243378 RepID=UPI004039E40F
MMKSIMASVILLCFLFFSTFAAAEEKLTFYHNDMLGSPVAASDKEGKLLWRESYEPYGKKAGDEQSLNHRGYTGHAEDANTGLVYMQARYYDPLIGRFYSMDPVGYLGHLERGNPIQGMNRYAYANNNPYKYNDPDGEFLNFAIKFAADVALTAALNYAETGSLNLTGAMGEAAVGMLNPAKTLQKFNRVAKLYKKGGGCSFTPETLILTQDGYKAIIEVQVGDIVLSKNDITGELSWREVTDTFKDWHQETITFTVVDENGIQETITTTAEHPFYIAGQGWLPAGEVGIDTVFAGSSAEGAIKVVGITVNDSPQYAYNFTVDTDHTYFVGKTDVWVHNHCDFDATKGVKALPPAKVMDHHLLPRQFNKFFKDRGIDIDLHTVTLGEKTHLKGVHGRGLGKMPGGWNKRWQEFIDKNPNATTKEVYQQLGRMMDDFGLNNSRIHPYKK